MAHRHSNGSARFARRRAIPHHPVEHGIPAALLYSLGGLAERFPYIIELLPSLLDSCAELARIDTRAAVGARKLTRLAKASKALLKAVSAGWAYDVYLIGVVGSHDLEPFI